MKFLSCLVTFRRAYWKSFSTATSSHCRRFTLIRCGGTLKRCMHRCVACTKVIAILLLTYPHIPKYGCCHFVARSLAIFFREASASTPSNLSTEAMYEKSLDVAGGMPPGTYFLWLCSILRTPLLCLRHLGFCVCVHYMHVVKTVSTFLPEVTNQKAALLFLELWIMCWWGWFGPYRLSLWPLNRNTCVDKGVVVHMHENRDFSGKVRNPVMDLIIARHDKAYLFSLKVM